MRTPRCLLAPVLYFLLCAPLIVCGADTGRPVPQDGGPVPVTVDIFLLGLDAIDGAAQSFDANVYLEARWNDPRLADSERQTRTLPLSTIWHPRLQFLNQQRILAGLPDVAEVEPDGNVVQRGHVWESFSQPLDLKRFPFDAQRITVTLVPKGYEPDEVTLLPGTAGGILDTFSIADWQLLNWKTTTDVTIPGPAARSGSGGVALVLTLERLRAYYWLKVIAPLILVVAMS